MSRTKSTSRASAHHRVVSEHTDRPDFRNTVAHRHRRSDSAPPSPVPWASSHTDAPARTSVDDSALDQSGRAPKRSSSTFHLRVPSFDATSSLDNHDHHSTHIGLSFLHRRKVRKAGSLTEDPLSLPTSESPVEKRKSQLFAPLLHRRRSQHVHDEDVSPISATASTEEENAPESRPSQESHRNSRDMTRVLPKRSQTLRTQPYQAPYFFPTPGSVEADNYLPPRRNPVRSKTLSPDEVEHGQPQEMEC
ncbi:hypothetical protein B0H19DRAFT_1077573 [Mycena capillaripes]|nr:hypothetical protein B0H19DRAFT_1077573 [Mycena capillaripes]